MKALRKWYVQLALALLAALVLTVVLIILDRLEMGEEIFKTNVPGTTGEVQTVTFDLEASDLTHVLEIKPDVESGWGEPDVYLLALLSDPDGRELVAVGSDVLFGGRVDSDDHGSRNYTKRFEFYPEAGGEYTLQIRTLSDHVEDVYITIGRRSE
jgi:hypothetical protein